MPESPEVHIGWAESHADEARRYLEAGSVETAKAHATLAAAHATLAQAAIQLRNEPA